MKSRHERTYSQIDSFEVVPAVQFARTCWESLPCFRIHELSLFFFLLLLLLLLDPVGKGRPDRKEPGFCQGEKQEHSLFKDLRHRLFFGGHEAWKNLGCHPEVNSGVQSEAKKPGLVVIPPWSEFMKLKVCLKSAYRQTAPFHNNNNNNSQLSRTWRLRRRKKRNTSSFGCQNCFPFFFGSYRLWGRGGRRRAFGTSQSPSSSDSFPIKLFSLPPPLADLYRQSVQPGGNNFFFRFEIPRKFRLGILLSS